MNNAQPVRVWPLGGLGEIGMNCLAIEQDGQVLLVDCGVSFDRRGLGVDIIHPAFDSLEPYAGRIAGLFVTHGHEDHIGAIPYLLRRFDVPVWGPPYALSLIRERASDHPILAHARLTETKPGETYAVGSFKVEPIRVTHSIVDSTALAIQTSAGMIVHTGDFKFDDAPPDGEQFDVERLSAIGDRGVTLLLSDSTNSDSNGSTGGESGVGDVLEPIVAGAEGAVIVAMFASNVHRLRLLGDIARRSDRMIVPLGRSVRTHAKVAKATGYLNWPSDRVMAVERIREFPRSAILGIATGTQAEANAALARLARGIYPGFSLQPGDTVILSSRIIPGHEPQVFELIGDLLRLGVHVRTWMTDHGIHVSGHAYRGEQRRMMDLVRPRSFIPVHGTLHHLRRHGDLAREANISDVLVIENGDVACITLHGVVKQERVPVGRVHIHDGRVIAPLVLKERIALAAEGIVQMVIVLGGTPMCVLDVTLVSHGVMTLDEADDTMPAARRELRSALGETIAARRESVTDAEIIEVGRRAVRRALAKSVGYKPEVLGIVVRP